MSVSDSIKVYDPIIEQVKELTKLTCEWNYTINEIKDKVKLILGLDVTVNNYGL